MRFRFCGEGDCPDWVLMEINSLSRLQADKLKSLCQIAVDGILLPPLDINKAEHLFSDTTLDEDIDLKACIACLEFIVHSTSRYNCDSNALHSELQQLGLPREHSTAIKRVIDRNFESLILKCRDQTLRINQLISCSGRVEEGYAVLDLNIDDKKYIVKTSEQTLDVLLKNLEEVRGSMLELQQVSL